MVFEKLNTGNNGWGFGDGGDDVTQTKECCSSSSNRIHLWTIGLVLVPAALLLLLLQISCQWNYLPPLCCQGVGRREIPPFGLLLPTSPYNVLFTTFAQHSFFSSLPSWNAEVILMPFPLANKIRFLYSSESRNNAVPLSDLGITQCDRLCWAACLSPVSAETDSRDHCL